MSKKTTSILAASKKDNQAIETSEQLQDHKAALENNKASIDKTSNTDAAADTGKSQKTPGNKHISDADYQAILSYMQEHYPKCFPAEGKLIALSIGLHHQLFAIENIPFSRMKLRKFLQRYTRSKEYRQSLIVGNDRFDLVGRPTSKILEVEANHWKWKKLQAEKKTEEIKKANHDSLIKKAMESPVAAKELLAEYLPAEFRDFIDLDTLKLEKESYIEDSLKTRFNPNCV